MRTPTVTAAPLMTKRAIAPPRPMKPASFAAALANARCPSSAASATAPSSAAAPPRERESRAVPRPTEPDRERPVELDTAARTAALLAPPPSLPPPTTTPAAPSPPPGLDPTVMTALLDTAAFWGDGTRGVARLRFGGRARGGLAGATITLEHDGDRLRLVIDGAEDHAVDELRARLAARGVALDE